jgi:hypothetical protein
MAPEQRVESHALGQPNAPKLSGSAALRRSSTIGKVARQIFMLVPNARPTRERLAVEGSPRFARFGG